MRLQPRALMVILTVILALCGLMATAPATQAAPCGDGSLTFSGGSGTSGAPYLISNQADLVSLREGYTTTPSYYSCIYLQTADITLTSTWQHGIGFSTPGSALYKPFEGSYDGGAHSLTNLTINAQAVTNANQARELGFIGLSTSGSASVSNLNLVNVSITCGYEAVYAGMLAAEISGSVTRSSATGSVTCTAANAVARMGGLIGYANGPVSNDWVSGTITIPTTPPANFSPNSVGGVIGRSDGSAAISNVLGRVSIVNFSSAIYAGVVIGYNNTGPVSGVYGQDGLTAGLTSAVGVGSDVGVSLKSSSQLQDITTYIGWSISPSVNTSTVWGIDPAINGGFPFLQSLPTAGGDMTPILQALPVNADGTCANLTDIHVAYQSGVTGGWGKSWAEWVNGGTGGPVCVRTLIYSGGRWIISG